MVVIRYDEDRFRQKWNGMEDPEGASAEAVRLCEDILRGRLDPVAGIDLLATAIEAAWDGPRGNLHVAHEALLTAEVAFYDAERRMPGGSPKQIQIKSRSQILIARSWHRKENFKQAALIAYNVIRSTEELVGGRQALLEVIARPTPNACAEAAVEALGVFIAALRRVESHPTQNFRPGVAEVLYGIGFDLVSAYLGPELSPAVIYPGTDGLAAQWFYRLVHDPAASDDLVRAFYELDRRTRPPEKRSEATAHALEAEYAVRFGSAERARSEGVLFIKTLELLGMVRHLATVRKQGYLAA